MTDVAPGRGTTLYGIVGHPLTHTLSPLMQNVAFRSLGLTAVYLPFPLPREDLRAGLMELRERGVLGLNVTAPFKGEALELVDDLDPVATRCRSVNTLRLDAERIQGTSTDGEGLLRDLKRATWSPRDRRAALVGSGGAARAIGLSLIDAGAAITVFARRPQAVDWVTRAEDEVRPWADLATGAPGCELIVQCTPLGSDGVGEPPLAWSAVDPSTLVMDIVYRPRLTPFLEQARARGCRVRSGLGMLLHQGAASFEFWTGRPAPLEVMQRAIGA